MNLVRNPNLKALITIALIGIFGRTAVFGQILRYPVSLPYINLSAYSNAQQDAFSFTTNQAALATQKKKGAGVFSERRFMLAALGAYRFAVALPTPNGNFGLQLDYAGFKNFSEQKIGLAYARTLGHVVDAGIQFNYYGYRIPAYNSASTVNVEAGAIFHFTEKLNGGLHVYNLFGTSLGKSTGEKLASSFSMGFGYDASSDFFAGVEIIKQEDKAVNLLAGIQYHFDKIFFARLGIESETGTVYGGAGVGWKNLRLDLSASYHPQLGLTPGILLMTEFQTPKK